MVERQSVLVVGLNDLYCNALRVALLSIPDVRIVGDVVGPAEAPDRAGELQPDAVLLGLPHADDAPSTLRLLSALRTRSGGSKLLVVAHSLRLPGFVALAGMGVHGFVLWRDLDLAAVRHCLRAILQGELLVASRSLPDDLLDRTTAGARPQIGPAELTEREQIILQRMAAGLTHKEIAAASGLSLRTVKRVIAGLEQKLDAPSPFVLGVRAGALGLVAPP
jgi:DNA-binding NarL/FixJ family response regulator